jgi:hypothetical protein
MLLYCWELRTWEIHEPKKNASPKEEALTSALSNTIEQRGKRGYVNVAFLVVQRLSVRLPISIGPYKMVK